MKYTVKTIINVINSVETTEFESRWDAIQFARAFAERYAEHGIAIIYDSFGIERTRFIGA